MMSILETSIYILLLCMPPLVLMMMLGRRHNWALQHKKRALRIGMNALAVILIFNLLIALFATPKLSPAAIGDDMNNLTMLAAALSWATVWCAFALLLVAPARRYRRSAARSASA